MNFPLTFFLRCFPWAMVEGFDQELMKKMRLNPSRQDEK
jgi:hypothetical protein